DQSAMVFLKVEELMETDFVRLKEFNTLGDLVRIISSGHRNIFPVIDNFGKLLGVVQLDDLREDMFKPKRYSNSIRHYTSQPREKIIQGEPIQNVLLKFENKHTWMLPVVTADNRYLGFISKSQILNAYREQLIKISQ
ncbi:MAG: CBS domain-containing protein, partial [Rikenellaceae bacterium]